jgi:YggT family protein
MSFGQAIIAYFISPLLSLLVFVVFANVILSWLIAFNVINPHNQFIQTVWRFTNAFTEPFLGPIRSVLPNLGGIDLSPLILLLIIFFVRDWLLMGQIYPML